MEQNLENKFNNTYDDFKVLLQTELETRTRRNPSYSLRSFAKALNVGHASLSQIINGKRKLSLKMAIHLGSSLGLSPEVLDHHLRKLNNTNVENKTKGIEFTKENQDQFNLISSWYHYAIMELMYLKGFNPDFKWIAKKLKISSNEVKSAVNRLVRLKYLEIKEDGSWIDLTSGFISSSTEGAFTTAAKRNHQKELFSKALEAIDEYGIDKRSHSGVTLAIDSKNIDEVRELISNFRKQLTSIMGENSNNPDEVYQLSIAFFPLTQNFDHIKGDHHEL